MAYVLLFFSNTKLYYILVKLEHSNFIIFFNIVEFVFLTHLPLHFGPILDFSDVLLLNYYFKVVYMLLFLSSTNLYYILVKLEHSIFIIFFNIVEFLFLTPLQRHIGPIFDLSDVLLLNFYCKMVYVLLFLSSTNLYNILVKLEHSNFIIFFNIIEFVF